jgi:hypothetical protein
MPNPRIHAVRCDTAELSIEQIERLMTFGMLEAEIIDRIETATRAGDREAVWQLAEELTRIEDEVHQPPSRGVIKVLFD